MLSKAVQKLVPGCTETSLAVLIMNVHSFVLKYAGQAKGIANSEHMLECYVSAKLHR